MGNQPVTYTTPSTSTPRVPTIPQDELLAMQKSMNLPQEDAKERINLINLNIPIIPLSTEQQQAVSNFQNTTDTAPTPTTEMSQQVKNATVPLVLSDENDKPSTSGSGTIVGMNSDRTKILLSTGIHSFLNMLDIDPTSSSPDDMIIRAKQEIQKKLGKSFFNNSTDHDRLAIPLKDKNGNKLNVKDAKFVAVNGADGSEQILVEVTLDKPLDSSFAALPVATAETVINQNSRILTGGYTPQQGYLDSPTGRVYSPTLQSGIANESRQDANGNIIDPKSDDKKYNDIFLVTNVPGIKPGTSGGTVATIDTKTGQLVYVGTITAKSKAQNGEVGWISALNEDFVGKINAWNGAQ